MLINIFAFENLKYTWIEHFDNNRKPQGILCPFYVHFTVWSSHFIIVRILKHKKNSNSYTYSGMILRQHTNFYGCKLFTALSSISVVASIPISMHLNSEKAIAHFLPCFLGLYTFSVKFLTLFDTFRHFSTLFAKINHMHIWATDTNFPGIFRTVHFAYPVLHATDQNNNLPYSKWVLRV